MANKQIRSTVSIAGNVGGTTRSISSTVSKEVSAVVDTEVVVTSADAPQLLIEFESSPVAVGIGDQKLLSRGSLLSGAQQIIIQNNDSEGCAEILIHLDSYSNISVTGTTYAAHDSDPDTITDSGNGFITAGFVAGQKIRVSGSSEAGNNTTHEIASVAAGTLTLTSASTLTIDDVGDTWTIAVEVESQRYLSSLLPAGRMLTLPSTRMLIHDEKTSAGNFTKVALTAVSAAAGSGTYMYKTYGGLVTTNGAGGYGATNIGTACGGAAITGGIVPGSLRATFNDPGYQAFGFIKNGYGKQTSATEPGLAANTAYAIGLTVDGGTTSNNSFTTHATDVTWGSPGSGTGILAKIQEDLDNTNRGCDVAIIDGDIVFTSRSRVQGTGSIALGNPGGSGVTIFGVGTIPAVGSLQTAVASTNNTETDNTLWDNGDGTMTRKNGGTGLVNYGEKTTSSIPQMEMVDCPANATIKMAWQCLSAHSGNNQVDKGVNSNAIIAIYGRSVPHYLGAGTAATGERICRLRVTAWD